MKKRNIEAFDVQWKKHRENEKATCTKAEANFWFQVGKRTTQAELQKAWDKKKVLESK